MSNTVTFAGTTIITPTGGVIEDFKRGIFERKKTYPHLPRSGALAKDLGRYIATHVLTITYTNVSPSDLGDLFDVLENLHYPLTG